MRMNTFVLTLLLHLNLSNKYVSETNKEGTVKTSTRTVDFQIS